MNDLKLYGKDEREVDPLVNPVRVISREIGMEFDLKKCGALILKKEKVVKFEGVDLPVGQKIKTVDDDGYKSLWVLEYDDLLHEKIKNGLRSEYCNRMKKL